MLLHRTPLLEIHYDPRTDIMRVEWPDIEEALSLEVEHSFGLIRDSVQSYYIKRFLIDSRQTKYVPDLEVLLKTSKQFLNALKGTTIQKIARLQSGGKEREMTIEQVSAKINLADFIEAEFRTFTDEKEAMNWLLKE